VLLDRDGTLNVRPAPHEYVSSADEFVWLEGAQEALAQLARAGFSLAVVSNQRGVARGLVAPGALAAIDERIQRDLRPRGCAIGAFRYCVHELTAGCGCRKPRPGMLLDVAGALGLDLARSWMVGDSLSDVRAGRAAGCRTALITKADNDARADLVAPSLAAVARRIVADAY
jgi:D-glycero-D-manno-heptose 1,7-bisphosphate phosphatase